MNLNQDCRSPLHTIKTSDPATNRAYSLPPPTPVDRIAFIAPIPSSIPRFSLVSSSGPLRFSATFPFPFYDRPVSPSPLMHSQATPGLSAPPNHRLHQSYNSPTLTTIMTHPNLVKGKQATCDTPVLNSKPFVFHPSYVPHRHTPISIPSSPHTSQCDPPQATSLMPSPRLIRNIPPSASNPLSSPYRHNVLPPATPVPPSPHPQHRPPHAPPLPSPSRSSLALRPRPHKVDLPDVSKLPILSSSRDWTQ
jgi:hypothetical protein